MLMNLPAKMRWLGEYVFISVDAREIVEARGAGLVASSKDPHRAMGLFSYYFEFAKANGLIHKDSTYTLLGMGDIFDKEYFQDNKL